MNASIPSATAAAAQHPLLARLVALTGAAALDLETFDVWANRPGAAMLVFVDDPDRHKETLDLAVIVPELARRRARTSFAWRCCRLLRRGASRRAMASRAGRRS